MKIQRAIYIGGLDSPKKGEAGNVWKAHGFYDEESPEFQAFCFQPDSLSKDTEICGYYVGQKDLDFIS